jgi:hypothetical protein
MLAYVCQLTGIHDADLKGAEPLTKHPWGRTAMLKRIWRHWRADRHPRGGRQMAWQRRVLPAKFRNFKIALGILKRPVFC